MTLRTRAGVTALLIAVFCILHICRSRVVIAGPTSPATPSASLDESSGPPLASLPALSFTGSMIRLLAHHVLPFEVTDGGSSVGWLTDVVYCGQATDRAGGKLRAVLCESKACPAIPQEERWLSPGKCDDVAFTVPHRVIVDVLAMGSPGRIELSVVSPNGRKLMLPPVLWGDMSFPISGNGLQVEASLKAGPVRFESRFVETYFRLPLSGFGQPPVVIPVVQARGDAKLQELEMLAGSRVVYVTIPVATLSDVVARTVARVSAGGQGLPFMSRGFDHGLQVSSELLGLSLEASPNGTELLVIGDVISRLKASDQQVIVDLPSKLTARFAQGDRRLVLADVQIEDRHDYACNGPSCQGNQRIRGFAGKIYAEAVGAVLSNGPAVALVPPGRHWNIRCKYGDRAWTQGLEVLSNVLQAGGSNLAFALRGDD